MHKRYGKRLASVLLMTILLVWCAVLVGTAETRFPVVTCEQIVSGEAYDQKVYAEAVAVKITPHHNLRYVWAIHKQDGTFAIIKDGSTHWYITEEQYNKASERHKLAIDSQEVMTLELDFGKDHLRAVRSFTLPGEMSFTEKQERAKKCAIALSVVCIIALPTTIVIACKKPRKSPPKLIGAQIVDSYNIHTSGNAAGRAIVGGIIGGVPGAVIGAATAKGSDIHQVTFLLFYSDGSKKVETVSVYSAMYDRYIELIQTNGCGK